MSQDRAELIISMVIMILTVCLPGFIIGLWAAILDKGMKFYPFMSLVFYGIILIGIAITFLRNIIF